MKCRTSFDSLQNKNQKNYWQGREGWTALGPPVDMPLDTNFYQNLACGAYFQYNNHELFENVDWN